MDGIGTPSPTQAPLGPLLCVDHGDVIELYLSHRLPVVRVLAPPHDPSDPDGDLLIEDYVRGEVPRRLRWLYSPEHLLEAVRPHGMSSAELLDHATRRASAVRLDAISARCRGLAAGKEVAQWL